MIVSIIHYHCSFALSTANTFIRTFVLKNARSLRLVRADIFLPPDTKIISNLGNIWVYTKINTCFLKEQALAGKSAQSNDPKKGDVQCRAPSGKPLTGRKVWHMM